MLLDLGRNDVGRVADARLGAGDRADGDRAATRTSCTWSRTSSGTARAGQRPGSTCCAPRSRRARCRARRRSAPWRSSTSSSRTGAASTAAPSATCRYTGNMDPAIAIRTLVVGRRHGLRAGGRRPRRRLAIPEAEYDEYGEQGARVLRAVAMARAGARSAGARSGGRDAAPDRQLRLVHLQPRAVPGRAGRRGPGRSATTRIRRRARSPRCSPTRSSISPGPCTPNEAGISMDVIRRVRRARCRSSACASGTSASARRSAATIVRAPRVMHGKTSTILHDEQGRVRGGREPVRARRATTRSVIAPRVAARRSSRSRPDTTWDDEIMGVRARARRAARGRAVPPRVDPDRRPARRLLAQLPAMAGGDARPTRAVRLRDRGTGRRSSARIVGSARAHDLAGDEMAEVIGQIMDGEATPAQIGGAPDRPAHEGRGGRRARRRRRAAMRSSRGAASRARAEQRVIDTCGTGGDGLGHASTSRRSAAILVAARAGVRGQARQPRACPSKCGSRRRARGARRRDRRRARAVVARCMRARASGSCSRRGSTRPRGTPAGPRRELGTRTIFNLLGPLHQPGARARTRWSASSTAAGACRWRRRSAALGVAAPRWCTARAGSTRSRSAARRSSALWDEGRAFVARWRSRPASFGAGRGRSGGSPAAMPAVTTRPRSAARSRGASSAGRAPRGAVLARRVR